MDGEAPLCAGDAGDGAGDGGGMRPLAGHQRRARGGAHRADQRGLVEKGRLAEIEAIYIALFGMAFSCWLGWTATGRSRWLVWPVTGLLFGLGLLAKGPPALAYFYAIAGFNHLEELAE